MTERIPLYKGVRDFTSIIGAEWIKLSQEEKAKYENMAKEEKEAFVLESGIRRGVVPIEFGAGADVD